jgi:hypothetical protein
MQHVLIDKRLHSKAVYVRSFREADCDIDHSLVVAELRERLSVSKQAAQKFDMDRFNLRNLNDVEIKEEYGVKSQIRLQLWKT